MHEITDKDVFKINHYCCINYKIFTIQLEIKLINKIIRKKNRYRLELSHDQIVVHTSLINVHTQYCHSKIFCSL